MPPRQLPLAPNRMLEFGEIEDPSSDAAAVPRGVPVSKAAEDRGGVRTPIDAVSIATKSRNMPKISRNWSAGVADLPDDNLNQPY